MPEQPAEVLRREGSVRTGIDVLDDGVFFRGIKVRGLDDDTVDVGLAIATLRHEALRHRPARGEQCGGVPPSPIRTPGCHRSLRRSSVHRRHDRRATSVSMKNSRFGENSTR
jgi:hypothetical protein